MDFNNIILAVILGTLAAIVYSLRILVIVERRIARMDENIFSITKRIVMEELKIEREQKRIEAALGIRSSSSRKRPAVRRKTARKKPKRRVVKRRR